MPFPNEHACRLRSIGDFKEDSFRRTIRDHDGKKYDVIIGKLKETDDWADQTMRYSNEKWPEETARNHCQAHNGNFEPAEKAKEKALCALYNRPLLIAQEELNNVRMRIENGQISQVASITQEVFKDTLLLRLRGIIEQRGDDNISIESLCSIMRGIDKSIRRIVLDFDTPGGSVDGIQALTEQIKRVRESGIKVISISNPLCCSGGYWIASACEKIYLSSSTARIGSVGVVAIHEDISRRDEIEGKKITEIVAGKYKRIDSEHKPLSPEGRSILQSQVDYIYSLFVDEISKNRNIAIERVIAEIGDGRMFIGRQALDVGIADGIMSLDDILSEETIMAEKQTVIVAPIPTQTQNPSEDEMEMERLRKENEDLKRQIEELKKSKETGDQEAKAAIEKEKKYAAEAERNRIKALEEIAPFNCSSLLLQAKSEGWPVERAAVEFLKASKGVSVNPLRAESHVVPSFISKSEDQEREETAKRIAENANKNRIRS